MAKIENTIFTNLIVPYGGAFLINEQIDLRVTNVQILNVKALSGYIIGGAKYGTPGFLFLGNNFYGNRICCRNLSTLNIILYLELAKSLKYCVSVFPDS